MTGKKFQSFQICFSRLSCISFTSLFLSEITFWGFVLLDFLLIAKMDDEEDVDSSLNLLASVKRGTKGDVLMSVGLKSGFTDRGEVSKRGRGL